MKALKAHIEANLPHYAQPVFLRLSEESDTTSTFKFKKTNLVKAGFNPANISEPLMHAEDMAAQNECVRLMDMRLDNENNLHHAITQYWDEKARRRKLPF